MTTELTAHRRTAFSEAIDSWDENGRNGTSSTRGFDPNEGRCGGEMVRHAMHVSHEGDST